MKPPNRTNRINRNLDENQDCDGDFSNGSGDEYSPDTDRLAVRNGDSTFEDSQSTMNTDNDVSNPDNLPFNTTAGFSLKIVKNYKSSKHPVWLMYGYLMREQKVINRVRDRVFCKKCFDKKKFKR